MSHHQQAIQHKANLPFLNESHSAYPHTQTHHGVVYQDHQTLNVTDLPAESNIPPTTSLSARAFSGSNFIDFEIPRSIHVLKSATLNMEIVNNDQVGRYLFLPVAYNLLDRVELFFGSSLVETISGEAMYLNHCTNNNIEKRKILTNAVMVDPETYEVDDVSRVVKNNGLTVKEVYIRLYSLLSTSNLFLPGIASEIRIRIHFADYKRWGVMNGADAAIVDPPTVDPTLQSCNLTLQHVILSDNNYKNLSNLYRNNQVNIKFLDHRFQSFSQTTTANVSFNHVLSSINGLVSHMYIFMRSQNPTGREQTDFKLINRFHLSDSSGSNLFNGIQYSNDYIRSIYAADHFENSHFFATKPVYPVAFSNDVMATVNSANNLGSRYFTSQEQIHIIPGHTGPVEVMIICYAHCILNIKNGQVSVSRS